MRLDYAGCAKEICDAVGGKKNISSATHCATRLRLAVADSSAVDMEKLESIEGVKGAFVKDRQLQIIIGTGAVAKVYDEFIRISDNHFAAKDEKVKIIKTLGDVFVPILPAIVASGLMMGIVEALAKAIPAFAESDWFGILDMISNTAFVFLPVIIAMSAARVFGGNCYLGAVIGMIMIHPNLINAWSVGGMNQAEIPAWNLLGEFAIKQVGYQGHVIPVIISVWIMCKIEKWLHKHVPEIVDLFVTPLCTVVLTAFFALGMVGPIFSTAETYILTFAKWIITVGYGVGSMVIGALYPITVVLGIHHMYNVIEVGMLAEPGGYNTWMAIASAANFAQAGVCLAIGMKSKKKGMKAVAVPSAFSAALGITEPAIFGVNLRSGRAFLCGVIGGAVGAMTGAVLDIRATAYGVTGIPGFLITLECTTEYAIMLAVSGGLAFLLTWLTWHDDSAAKIKIYAPVAGKIIKRNDIPDRTFAEGVLGACIAIMPECGEIAAPFDGTVSMIADQKHAVGLTSAEGAELLIHVGLDTVKLNGDGFEVMVKENANVKKGQVIMRFDKERISKAKLDSTTVIVVTNSADYDKIKITNKSTANKLDEIIVLG